MAQWDVLPHERAHVVHQLSNFPPPHYLRGRQLRERLISRCFSPHAAVLSAVALESLRVYHRRAIHHEVLPVQVLMEVWVPDVGHEEVCGCGAVAHQR